MKNPQLSRKEEISKGCGKEAGCGTLFKRLSKDKVEDVYALCPTCQARLDEVEKCLNILKDINKVK